MITGTPRSKGFGADLPFLPAARNAVIRLHWETRCLLLVGLFFGFLAVAVIPPVVTFDGPGHFFRAVGISQGHFRAIRYSERNLGGPIPGRYSRFVHTLWSSYWPGHHWLKLSDWSAITRVKYGDTNPRVEGWTNTAVYSPANYLPQSLGMALSGAVSRSPLWAHRAGCALNLLVFLGLIAWALETIPRGRATLLLFAVSPFVLIQAATVNIDGINFAVPVCLFAHVWRMRNDRPSGNGRLLIGVTCLALWLCLLKPPNIVCLGFLFFVPASYFKGALRKAVWLAATIALGAVLWNFWNAPYLDVNVNGWFDPTHPPVREQKAWLVQHPTDFFDSFKIFLVQSFPHQWKNFYGDLGGWAPDWALHLLYDFCYWFLAVLLLLPVRGKSRDRTWAAVTLLHAAGLLFVMALALWIVSGVKYTGVIPFLGGRYLFLIFFLCLLAWNELVGFRFLRAERILLAIGLTLNVVGMGSVLIPTALTVAG